MLLGRYEVLETIGRGATSSVFRARDTLIDRIVAVKLLQAGQGGEWRDRFLREARIVGQFSHPSIVSLYDVGIDDSSGAPYLVMELVAGKTLEQLLAAGHIRPGDVHTCGAEMARALAYAHRRGVVHGDVKPANVLVNENGGVKLTDFGVARLATQLSHTGQLMGTPAYLSPEQIEGRPKDARADLFSLGIILFQIATGERPFQGDSVAEVCGQILRVTPPLASHFNRQLPPALDRVLARCLSKDPEARYADGDALAADLEAARPRPAERRRASDARRTGLLQFAAWAAPVFLLAASASLAHDYFRHRLRLPDSPRSVFAAPKPPEILSSLPGEILPVPEESAPPPVPAPKNSYRQSAAFRSSVNRSKQAAPAQHLSAGVAPAHPSAEPVPLAPAAVAPAPPAPAPAESLLTIEILTRSSDDTLVISADRQVLFRFSLAGAYGDDAVPIRRVFPLAPGAHRLNVALYKKDKTLRTEKEGLAELRSGEKNLLTIRIGKRSKFLLGHAPSLAVSWPDASSNQSSGPGRGATSQPSSSANL